MTSALPLSASPHRKGAPPPRGATSAPTTTPSYRPDIDGLRGLAVLSLMAVHLVPSWSRGGGVVGIDMFLVISGYLVSDSLLSAHAAGRFSLTTFYGRRIQKIVPSLCLVLIACLAFSWLFTFPGATLQIGRHVAAASLFVSNFALWKEAGSSDLGFAAMPLFHLWALALDVQFCVLWPITVTCLIKHKRSVALAAFIILVLSFATNIAFDSTDPAAAFLLPTARAWELLAGAWLASTNHGPAAGPVAWIRARLTHRPHVQRQIPNTLAWTGVALLATSFGLIDSTQQVPGWWALLPTIGTVALLAAGPGAFVNRQVLLQPILRFYGAISYPLYLWHWPLLSFPVVMGLPLTHELRVIILIASVVLAALTYELVEKRSRPQAEGPPGSGAPAALISALACVGLIGFAVQEAGGLSTSFPESMRGGPAVIELR